MSAQREEDLLTDYDLVVRAARVVTPAGEIPSCLGVRGGRIVAVEPPSARLNGAVLLELGEDEVLLPGSSTRTCM
jgi:allantoinase